MAKAGDAIENPVSGERVTFLQTSGDTGGALLRWEHALRPGGRVPRDHIHAARDERFEITAGVATVRLGRETFEAQAGEVLVIPAGTPHGLRNESSDEVRVLTELRPSLRTEEYFETVFALARDGKVTKAGVPNVLRLAVIVRALRDDGYLPGQPVALQKAGRAVLGAIGRLLGYRATYP